MEASKILSGAYEEKEIAVSKLNSVLLGRILNELWEYGTTRKNIQRYYTPKHLTRYINCPNLHLLNVNCILKKLNLLLVFQQLITNGILI